MSRGQPSKSREGFILAAAKRAKETDTHYCNPHTLIESDLKPCGGDGLVGWQSTSMANRLTLTLSCPGVQFQGPGRLHGGLIEVQFEISFPARTDLP